MFFFSLVIALLHLIVVFASKDESKFFAVHTGDHYEGAYVAGKWNYDYSQSSKTCPKVCSTKTKCGPYCWSKIADPANMCGGSSQTPINIVPTTAVDNKQLRLPAFKVKRGGCRKWAQFADDHAFEISFADAECTDLGLSFKGVDYTLAQFHMHAPSEHAINGRLADAELHMVHKSADGKLLVLGVLLDGVKSSPDNFLDNFWVAAKAGAKEHKIPADKVFSQEYEVEAVAPLDPYVEFLPQSKSFYTYSGSLTTVPCTEGVTWLVFAEPIQVGKDDIKNLVKAVKFEENTITLAPKFADNRPVMPVGDRTVYKYSA